MRNILCLWLVLVLFSIGFSGTARGEVQGELLVTNTVWERARRNFNSDLIRFDDRWLLVCCESSGPYTNDEALRILSSTDGDKWSSLALLESPTPGRGLYGPKFNLRPDGKLLVSAVGILPRPDLPEPLPRFGGTTYTLAWETTDGREWSKLGPIGKEYYPLSRIAWHKDIAYCYSHGTICGSSQTVSFFSSKTGHRFEELNDETFSAFFPMSGELIFQGDRAICLMSRINAEIDNAPRKAMVGTAKPPFDTWEWKETDQKVSYPNLLQLSDKQVIGAVILHDKKPRLALGEFNPETGNLREFLEVPTDGQTMPVGLAHHAGELLVSYHATEKDRLVIKVAKVKITAR
jgi:hypothetical protein